MNLTAKIRKRILIQGCLLALLSPLLQTPKASSEEAKATPTLDALLSPGPHKIAHQDIRLTDPTRSTPASGDYPGAKSRTLVTRVYYPAKRRALEAIRPGPPPIFTEEGPHPLIMYSHGFMSFRSEGEYIAEHLASHGFIVIAPNFPATNYRAPGAPNLGDVISQPGDISFLIDWALEETEDLKHPIAGQVDPDQIAAMGLSLGGLTTTLITFHPQLRDERIRLAVAMAPPTFMLTPAFFDGVETPYMAIGGDIDAIVPHDLNLSPLAKSAPLAWLATLEGASHTGFTSIASSLLRFYANPDSLGCAQVSKNLPDDPHFMASLSTGDDGIEYRDIPPPCPDEHLPRAMRAKTQHTLTIALIVAFFQEEGFGEFSTPPVESPLSALGAEVPSLQLHAPKGNPTATETL